MSDDMLWPPDSDKDPSFTITPGPAGVMSVDDRTGEVKLDDLYDPEGAAAAARTAAVSDAQAIIDALTASSVGADAAGTAAGLVAAHVAAVDPHGDRAAAVSLIAALNDTLAPVAYSGVYNDLDGKPTLGTAAALDTGTGVGLVVVGGDARLTDTRTPLAHSHDASAIDAGVLSPARLAAGVASVGRVPTVDTGGTTVWETPAGGDVVWIDWNNLTYGGGATPGAALFGSGGGGNISGRAFTAPRAVHGQVVLPSGWGSTEAHLWWGHTDLNPESQATLTMVYMGATGLGGQAGRVSAGASVITVGSPHVLNRTALGTPMSVPAGPAFGSAFLNISNAGPIPMTTPFIVVGVELRRVT